MTPRHTPAHLGFATCLTWLLLSCGDPDATGETGAFDAGAQDGVRANDAGSPDSGGAASAGDASGPGDPARADGGSPGDAGAGGDAPHRDGGADTSDADGSPPDPDDGGSREAGAPDANSRDAATAEAGSSDGGTELVDRVVDATIIVAAGETFDGSGTRFIAGESLGDGSQSESQKPVFRLEDGATLRNVVLGAPAADGIHTYGDAQLENIVWEDIGEDALTIKEMGSVVLDGGSARNGDDKVFQINAPSVFRLRNFSASNAGKLIRQNGGTTFKVEVYIERCDVSHMNEGIFRTDSSTSTVSFTDSRYSDLGDELFIGVRTENITQRNNVEY